MKFCKYMSHVTSFHIPSNFLPVSSPNPCAFLRPSPSLCFSLPPCSCILIFCNSLLVGLCLPLRKPYLMKYGGIMASTLHMCIGIFLFFRFIECNRYLVLLGAICYFVTLPIGPGRSKYQKPQNKFLILITCNAQSQDKSVIDQTLHKLLSLMYFR